MSNDIIINGLGGNEPIYGYGGGNNISIAIVPDRGTILGGDSFIIVGAGLSNTTLFDTFPGVVLDPLKWTDVSAAGGTATVDGGLNLSIPTSGGTAAIR